jgi:hypothetical protein
MKMDLKNKMLIKKHFNDYENDDISNAPLLYRQVATRIIYNEQLNTLIDLSIDTNTIWRQKAYMKKMMDEYLKKYIDYKNNTKIFYSVKFFKNIMKNKIPLEIILEIIKYIF